MKKLCIISCLLAMVASVHALEIVLWDFETDLGGWGPGAGTVTLGTNPLTGSQCMVINAPEGWQTGAYNDSMGNGFIDLTATPIIQLEVTYVASEWGDVGWITQDVFVINSGGGWGQKGLSSGDGAWGAWAGDATRTLQYDYKGYNLSGGWSQLSIMINGGSPSSGPRGNYYIDNIKAVGPDPITSWMRYECEDATLIDTTVLGEDADCSGGEYVSIQKVNDTLNGQIQFTVNAPRAREYNMKIGQRSGGDDQRYDSIYLNEVKLIDQHFSGLISWGAEAAIEGINGWSELAVVQDLFSSVQLYGSEDGDWQLWSRWAPAWDTAVLNTPMTVNLLEGKNTIAIYAEWGWTNWDFIEVELGYIAKKPTPADGGLAIIGQNTTLSWNNALLDLDKAEVWFGQTPEPNELDPNTIITSANYKDKLSLISTLATPADKSSIAMPELIPGANYTWVVDGFKGVPDGGDPNYPGVFWTFTATDNIPPVANAGADQYKWLDPASVVVTLDGSGSTDDGKEGPLAYSWVQTAGPAVTLDSPTSATTTVTMTKLGNTTEANGNAPYVFKLTVNDGLWTATDTVTVHVNSSSCTASIEAGGFYFYGDIASATEAGVPDCKVDLYDFAEMALNWLACSNTFEACE